MKKRLAAEWEPVVGVMIGWPLNIPISLYTDLAKDLQRIVLLVDDENAKSTAAKISAGWGVDTSKLEYVISTSSDDACWTRDWGPHPIFDEAYHYHMGCPNHVYSTPFCPYQDDGWDGPVLSPYTKEPLLPGHYISLEAKAFAPAIAQALGVDWFDFPFSMTGGNMMSDGYSNLMFNVMILIENRLLGFHEEEMETMLCQTTGMTNFSVMPNYEDFGIQHIDCFLKMLDEERLLVLRLPKNHPNYKRYENIVDHCIRKMNSCHGRPYEILRIDTDVYDDAEGAVASYTNAIILNKNIYVPLYGMEKADQAALETWRAAMPGYTVKGYTFVWGDNDTGYVGAREHSEIGWFDGDALHCRTRALWDEQMLYIHVNTLPPCVNRAESYRIAANIVDYSRQGLIRDHVELLWRKKGEKQWNKEVMKRDFCMEWYAAEIVGPTSGDRIEYCVFAEDNSGRKASRPVTAPEAYFSFTVY